MAKKILIVDDDMYIRDLYEEVVKEEGFEVDTANDGATALEKLKQGGYDLVLLDIMMPKLDGFGIMDELRKNPPAVKNGPFILLTNLDHGPLMQEALDKGAASFMIKADITPNDLVNEVKKHVNNDEQPTN